MANFMSINRNSITTLGKYPCCFDKILSFNLTAIVFCWENSKLNLEICSDYATEDFANRIPEGASQRTLISSGHVFTPVMSAWLALSCSTPSFSPSSLCLSSSRHNAKLQMHKILNVCLLSNSSPISVVFDNFSFIHLSMFSSPPPASSVPFCSSAGIFLSHRLISLLSSCSSPLSLIYLTFW